MGIIAAISTITVEGHLTDLVHSLVREPLDRGLGVAGGEPGPHLEAVVSVGEFEIGGQDTTDDPRASPRSARTR